MFSLFNLNIRNVLISLILLLLLALPIYLQNNLYYVGGDDTRLYYIYPDKFLENLSLNIISDNSLGGANTGYYPPSQMAPFLYVVKVLKWVLPFVNTQNLLYGLNYSFGFLFFYLLLGLWLPSKPRLQYLIKVVSSLLYIFSPFLLGSLYKHHLFAIYLIFLMPLVLYLFIRAVYESKSFFTITAIFVFSIFSATINTFPHWIPIIITSIPLFFWLFLENKKSFLIQALVFLVSGTLLNFHWMYHLINSQYFVKGIARAFEFYSSTDFVADNIRGIRGTATLYSPLAIIFMTMDRLFLSTFSIINFFSSIFLVIIIIGGALLSKIKDKTHKQVYTIALLSFLLSWFLFSPNLGTWGPDLFVWLSTSLPFMTMFRNMYDKFALPLAFYLAFTFAIGFSTIERVFPRKLYISILIGFTLVLVVWNAKPLYREKVLSEGTLATVTGTFNDDFTHLVTYLDNLENESRILWIPMTAPNYVSVEDKYLKDHYYSGLSPLRVLAGRGDYAGRFSFLIPRQNLGDYYLSLIKDKKYEDFGHEMQRMNARYILVDKQELPKNMQSFLYDEDRKYLSLQSSEFRENLIGEKLSDFGERYSLYEIKKKYMSNRLFLTQDVHTFPKEFEDLHYKKVSSEEYEIQINNLTETKYLVFIDPYYKAWSLTAHLNNEKSIPLSIHDEIAYGWANAWKIDPNVINAHEFRITLYFEPARINKYLYPASFVAYCITCLYIVFYFLIYLKKIWPKSQ